jgi:hypothetical protein
MSNRRDNLPVFLEAEFAPDSASYHYVPFMRQEDTFPAGMHIPPTSPITGTARPPVPRRDPVAAIAGFPLCRRAYS